jgi:uncharacterized membrane protein YccF (DUF307 family)
MERQATAAAPAIFCTNCDIRNPSEAAYCVNCGAALAPAGQPLADRPPAPPRPVALRRDRCGGCGIVNPAGAIYCVNCGAGLAVGIAGRSPTPAYAPPLALAVAASSSTIVQHIYVAAAPPTTQPLLVRALWFFFVGLWLGQAWLVIAWLFNLTLLGLPLGMKMLSMLPQVMTLRAERDVRPPPDRSGASFVVRAVYFVLIGWWLSLLWMELAWLAAASVIGLPLAFLMFERVGTVMTLAES